MLATAKISRPLTCKFGEIKVGDCCAHPIDAPESEQTIFLKIVWPGEAEYALNVKNCEFNQLSPDELVYPLRLHTTEISFSHVYGTI
jgi:hypothetical protein